MLGLCEDAELPELLVELLHVSRYSGLDGAEVVVVELLTLGSLGAEEGPAGELEVLYADPDFFRSAVGIWGRKWYRTFEKWYAALQVKYDPLNNYDRTETWSTDTTSSTTATDSATTSSTTNKSSYDSSSLTPYESISGSSGGNSSVNGSDLELKTGRAYGNIGVTTSQQMLQSELELQEWNLYQHMIDLFKTELLIPIY